MHTSLAKLFETTSAPCTIILRFMVGLVFLTEGIQKFLFAEAYGAGRFAQIGIPHPHLLGPFVGGVEVVCGILILLGLLTRVAAVPLLGVIIVALLTTKLNMIGEQGLWLTLHNSRTDWAMLLGTIYLLINGGGAYSYDYSLSVRNNTQANSDELTWVI